MLLREVKALYEKFEFSGFNSESRTFGALLKDDKPLNDLLKEILIEYDVDAASYRKLLATKLYDAAAAYAEHSGKDNDFVGPEIWKAEDARRELRRTSISVMMHFDTFPITNFDRTDPNNYIWDSTSYQDAPIFIGTGVDHDDSTTTQWCFKITKVNHKYEYVEIARRGIGSSLLQKHNVDTYYKQIAEEKTFKLLFDVLSQWVVFK